MIRIANGQGFWGDWLEAPVRLVDQGPSISSRSTISPNHHVDPAEAEAGRPELGYARDFPPLIGRLAASSKSAASKWSPTPAASIRRLRARRAEGAPGLKVAVVHGDDVFSRIDEFLGKGYEMRDMDTGEPISTIRSRSFRPTPTSGRSLWPKRSTPARTS
jgi:hypothetical protein